MSDLGSGIKQATEETAQAVKEVAKDVKDSVGRMLEQGVQSATGTQLTPQQIQQKQIDEQKQMAEARRKIAFYQRNVGEQKIVRQENKQKEMQRLQNQYQEKQITEFKQEQKKKQPVNPAVAYAGKVEFKRGIGG